MRSFTNIPIPEVLDWGGWDNAVGTEYIIMTHASGIKLSEKWPSMTCLQRVQCVKNISFATAEMANIKFPAYGSLYFDNAHTNSKSEIEISKGFCIGPYCILKSLNLVSMTKGFPIEAHVSEPSLCPLAKGRCLRKTLMIFY